MDQSENRHIERDSFLLMADLRADGMDGEFRIKVRNLSAGGMMGEGPVRIQRGAVVSVNIRNIGWVEGTIAWVQDSRFGVAFRDELDPNIARAKVGTGKDDDGFSSPRYTRSALQSSSGSVVRKI